MAKASAEELSSIDQELHQDDDLLESVMAACALVAFADDNLAAKEKEKVATIFQANSHLRVLNKEDVKNKLAEYIQAFKQDKAIGEAKAWEAIRLVSLDRIKSTIMVRACFSMIAADGKITEDEKAALKKVCQAVEYDYHTFGL